MEGSSSSSGYTKFFSFTWVRPFFAAALSKMTEKYAVAGLAIGALALYKLLSRCRPPVTTTRDAEATAAEVDFSESADLPFKQKKRDFTLEELASFNGRPRSSGSKSKGRGGEGQEAAAAPAKEEAATAEKEEEDESGEGEQSHAYISVKGRVYDTYSHPSGKNIYGPGGAYHVFVGKDVTYNLAKMSFAGEDMNQPPSQWKALTAQELSTLDDWITRFDGKYECVGFLCFNNPEEDAILRDLYRDERRAAGLPA